MPVSFLTNVQKQCYGRYTDEPTIAQLNHYFPCGSNQSSCSHRAAPPDRIIVWVSFDT